MATEQGYSKHWLMAFGGKLGGGEIWACGVRAFPHGDAAPDIGNYLKDVKTSLSAWFNDPNQAIPSTAKLSWIKMNQIDEQGHYVDRSHTNVIDVPDVAGGVSAQLPAFLSVAYTWTTSRTRGPGVRGHVYLPNYGWPAASLDPCMVSAANQAAMVVSGKKLLAIVSNGVGIDVGGGNVDVIDFVPCIASRVDKSLTIINGVSVGRVYDVQRRRKNAIEEQPVKSAFDWQNPGA